MDSSGLLTGALESSQSKIKLSGEHLKCRVLVLNENSPFALDTRSAGSSVDITMKMIGLKAQAISPVRLLKCLKDSIKAS